VQRSRSAPGLLTAAALLTACGGSVTRDVDVQRSPPPPIYTSLPDMPFAVGPGAAVRLDFEVPEAGKLAATIDWQDPANNLVAVFTDRGCHSVNDALAWRCSSSEVNGHASTCPAKPRVLAHSNYAPVALRLWIANTGTTADSGKVSLSHCRENPDCAATGSCLQCWSASPRSSCSP
jgi:hypothetical protein